MTNSADGEISLYEAMLLANGSLGRLPEKHLPCEDIPEGEPGYCGGPQPREEDYGNFYDNEGNPTHGGPAFRDTITVSGSLSGNIMAVGGAGLPPVGNGDSIDFNDIIIDGGGGGGHGLYLGNAVSNASIRDVALRNFSGDGIRLENDSIGNEFRYVGVENVGGHGISLFNNSSGNTFFGVFINVAGGDGIFVEGDSVQNEFSYVDQDPFNSFVPNINNTGGHGIHLTAGANRNSFRNVFIAGAGGSGIFLDGHAEENHFSKMVVTNSTLHGMHLSGGQVRFNRAIRRKTNKLSDLEASWDLEDLYGDSGGYGILIENGANSNLLGPRQVYQNAEGGIRVDGAGTDNNVIGKNYKHKPYYTNAVLPSLVHDNGDHGIRISNGASRNAVELMNVSGNQGDAVLIEGPDTDLNHVSGIWTGLHYFFTEQTEPLSNPNAGNSVRIASGASANVIGGFSIARNNFSNDTQNGILIEGADTINNVIRHTDVGRTPYITRIGYSVLERQLAGVGQNGIAIINNARENIIGSNKTDLRVHIDASPDAGILIDASDNNRVIGCFLGSPFEYIEFAENEKNRIGIHIRNGAKGNQIGEIGPMLGPDPNPVSFSGIVDRLNLILYTREAGIWIENAGGSLDPGENRMQPNVLQNNSIESDGVGLKITGDSRVNDIGGWRGGPTGFINVNEIFTQEDNYIKGAVAGVEIHNVTIPNPEQRNRFLNNAITSEFDEEDPPVPFAIRTGPPPGVGVLITGTSAGNIFGESAKAPNLINWSRVGVYIDGAHANTVRGNQLGYSFGPTNSIAGVVIRNGHNNRIGGRLFDEYNILEGNGYLGSYGHIGPTANPDAGGILVVEGQGNIVQNNEIRETAGDGILLVDTAGNTIGGPLGVNGNMITTNTRNGIAIKGNSSGRNIIQSNLVGTNRKGEMLGNEADGIYLTEGAAANLIGGRGPVTLGGSTFNMMAPNIIAHNTGHGVHVSGSGTAGNSILFNNIYNNGGLGIENVGGGNDELPPPTNMSYSVGAISGEVADVGLVPAGSIINVFSDSAIQGEVLLGQTTVKPGGAWTIPSLLPAPFSNITATVTHVDTGSTSEFALATADRGFNITRADGQSPGEQTVIFGEGGIPVLAVEAVAVGDSVKVNRVTLEATGSLLDVAQIDGVSIYRDSDGDGIVGEADSLIAGPFTYDADNGQVNLDLPGIVVEPDDPQRWIIVYQTSQSVAQGTTFSTKITNAAAVNAEFLFPIGLVAVPSGPFPAASDEFTVGL